MRRRDSIEGMTRGVVVLGVILLCGCEDLEVRDTRGGYHVHLAEAPNAHQQQQNGQPRQQTAQPAGVPGSRVCGHSLTLG